MIRIGPRDRSTSTQKVSARSARIATTAPSSTRRSTAKYVGLVLERGEVLKIREIHSCDARGRFPRKVVANQLRQHLAPPILKLGATWLTI